MYDIVKLHLATDVPDAIDTLVRDPQAIVICGGSDVLIRIREGKLAGISLVSIQGLDSLRGVTHREDGTIVIGPATTFAGVTHDPVIREHIPALGDATDQAGGPQLRNIGTIGGNICNGAPSADSAPTLLTLNAQLEITGPDGVRQVALRDFYAGPGRVHLGHGELLTAIHIRPEDYVGFGGHYIKYAQREAMDIATLSCAVHLRLSADKRTIEAYRLAFGVAAPTPIRCPGTEKLAQGQAISAALLETLGRAALEDVTPRDSWRGSKAFRRQLVYTLTQRATAQAIERAGGVVQ